MDSKGKKEIVRIGMFYDGHFFQLANNYFKYTHPIGRYFDIKGLHAFVRNEVAKIYETDINFCQIIDAHYFRGRLSAEQAKNKNTLYRERLLENVFMYSNVTTHYLPVRERKESNGEVYEKGIDVWLSLEAYELAAYKHFDCVVLFAGDSDYVPLVRKLVALGVHVILLGWEYSYMNPVGREINVSTAWHLEQEVSFFYQMNEIIDENESKNDNEKNKIISDLFLITKAERELASAPPTPESVSGAAAVSDTDESTAEEVETVESDDDVEEIEETEQVNPDIPDEAAIRSFVFRLERGYGFIKDDDDNIFFHNSNVLNKDFNSLQYGTDVMYTVDPEDNGRAKYVWVVDPE